MRKPLERLYDFPPSVGLVFPEYDPDVPSTLESVSVTEQHHANDCDIHNIVARYNTTGLWSDNLVSSNRKPMYGDFTNVDYLGLQNQIAQINSEFSLLPSDIRRKFNDDPQVMIDFIANPDNKSECISIGLLPHEQQDVVVAAAPASSLDEALNLAPDGVKTT